VRGICGVWQRVRPAGLGFTRHIAPLCPSLQPGDSEPHTPPAIRTSPTPTISAPHRRARSRKGALGAAQLLRLRIRDKRLTRRARRKAEGHEGKSSEVVLGYMLPSQSRVPGFYCSLGTVHCQLSFPRFACRRISANRSRLFRPPRNRGTTASIAVAVIPSSARPFSMQTLSTSREW